MKQFENRVTQKSNKRLSVFKNRNITNQQINDIENSAKYFVIKETLVDILYQLKNNKKDSKKYKYSLYVQPYGDVHREYLYDTYDTQQRAIQERDKLLPTYNTYYAVTNIIVKKEEI